MLASVHTQDAEWLASAFPGDYDSITNTGYEAWLADHVGHNEQNGRYKLSVNVSALPDHGPCYLVCGPYKVVVRQPGTYCFPLTDFTEYDLYTSPTAVPLTWEFDDGWDPPEEDCAPLLMSPAPKTLLGASRDDDHHYKIDRFPEVFVRPNFLTHEEALREIITVSCNAAGIAVRDYTSFSGRAVLYYTSPSTAQIVEADIRDAVTFYYTYNGKSVSATLSIYPGPCPFWPYCQYGQDCPYQHDWHENSTNGTGNASAPVP